MRSTTVERIQQRHIRAASIVELTAQSRYVAGTKVGVDGDTARYIPEIGFAGPGTFTFTASDGSTDGNLAFVTVTVGGVICAGDCDGSGAVDIEELVRGVDIALDVFALDHCPAFDTSADGAVRIDELVRAIALHGC
jgi:hypothetical protein